MSYGVEDLSRFEKFYGTELIAENAYLKKKIKGLLNTIYGRSKL